MKPGQKEGLPLRLEKKYKRVEEYMMQDVCRRIKKAGEITSTADWQINRLVGMGWSSEEVEREIKNRLKLTNEEIFRIYDKVIDWEYVRNKDIYEQVNANFVPYDQNAELQQITATLRQQTMDEFQNISNSLGYTVEVNGKLVFTPLAEYYQEYVDAACLEIVTGASDYNSALKRTVRQMAKSGLRTTGVTYASGHSDRVEVAARRAVMTGVSQLAGNIARMNAQKLGTNYYEVEAHAGARNTGSGYYNHQAWQGRVYTEEGLRSVCGYGEGGGLNGWNCYHSFYPFIPGISERNWSDSELDEMIAEENTPKEWNGKEYNTYQLTQKQREMERNMQGQRAYIDGLTWGGAPESDIIEAKAKYRGELSKYKYFCGKFGFQTQLERVYLDNRGRKA